MALLFFWVEWFIRFRFRQRLDLTSVTREIVCFVVNFNCSAVSGKSDLFASDPISSWTLLQLSVKQSVLLCTCFQEALGVWNWGVDSYIWFLFWDVCICIEFSLQWFLVDTIFVTNTKMELNGEKKNYVEFKRYENLKGFKIINKSLNIDFVLLSSPK